MIFLKRAKKYMIQKEFNLLHHDDVTYQINDILYGFIVNIENNTEYYYNTPIQKYVEYWNKPDNAILRDREKYSRTTIIPVVMRKEMEIITEERYYCYFGNIMYRYRITTTPIIYKSGGVWAINFKESNIDLIKVVLCDCTSK